MCCGVDAVVEFLLLSSVAAAGCAAATAATAAARSLLWSVVRSFWWAQFVPVSQADFGRVSAGSSAPTGQRVSG